MTVIRIWVTTLIHGTNAQKIYSMIALLTCLEALLGVINTCLPVMQPVFTKFGDSKVWSSLTSPLGSSRRSLFSRSNTSNRSGAHNLSSNGKRRSDGFKANDIGHWPSPREHLAPRFVDAKAANMMFSHHSQQSTVALGAPRPPPKSPHYQPEKRWDDKDDGITVQRDWDVERGDSVETDRRLLSETKYGRGW